jgi:hypothetical protein
MIKHAVLVASFLAITLVASVFSNAYALSSLDEENTISSLLNLDDNNGKKEKGGKNNSGKGSSSGEEEDDEEKESKNKKGGKGNKIKVKSNKGGRGQVSEVASNETAPQQQAQSKSGNDDDEESQDLLFPADFTIKGDGVATERGTGNSASSRMDAAINLTATTIRLEGNHVRVAVYGTITLDNKQIPLEDGSGIIIFFNDPGSKLFRGIIHITGKVMDENKNKDQKFHLRAFLLPPNESSNDDTQWAFVVKPAAKVGPKVRISQLVGELIQLDGDNTPLPPTANKKLDRFSVIVPSSSSVVAGVKFNVTVTALDSDGNVLKSYKGKANVTDLTGKVKPTVVSNFVNGVFSGKLNITKAMKSDKVTFTDVATGKKGTSSAFDVVAGPLAELDLSPSAATVQPGNKASFLAKALDKFDNEISPPTGLQFGWSLSSANFGSIQTSANTANFTASSSVTAETNVTLTVAVGALEDSSKITIKPQAAPTLDHFVITPISSPKVAGTPFAISITAVTSAGTTLASYTGPIELDDTTGTLTIETNNGFSSGVWTGSVNITKASSSVRINVQDASSSAKNGTSNAFEVVAGSLDHFKISEIANQTIAGVELEFTVTAKDAYENVVKNFNGTVTLSTNVHTGEISPNPYTFNSATDLGIHTFEAQLYNATQDAKITASGGGKSGSSNDFDVIAGAVDQVIVTPSDVSISPGQNQTFTAEATDAFGNVVGGVSFNWTLSSSALGTLSATIGTEVLFTANGAATETQSGALTATYGAKSGAATIQVVVV